MKNCKSPNLMVMRVIEIPRNQENYCKVREIIFFSMFINQFFNLSPLFQEKMQNTVWKALIEKQVFMDHKLFICCVSRIYCQHVPPAYFFFIEIRITIAIKIFQFKIFDFLKHEMPLFNVNCL